MSTRSLRNALALCLVGQAMSGCGSEGAAPTGTDKAPVGTPSADGTAPSTDGSAPSLSSGLPSVAAELAAIAAGFTSACSTTYAGDETRAAFDPTESGPHGLLLIAPDGSADPLNDVIPEAWRPHSADDIQLVACLGTLEESSVEVCHYVGTSRTLLRQRRSVTTRVVSPRSGISQTVTTNGAEPPQCPDATTNWEDVVGDLPTPQQIESDVIDRFVPVPDCAGSRPLASCLQCFRDALEAGSSGCGTPQIDTTEQMPPARTGQPVALAWQWETFTGALFLPAAGFDWSASTDAAKLTSPKGERVSFVPDTARSYSFLAKARLPDSDSGQVVQTRSYTIEARDLPVVQNVLGTNDPAFARVAQSSSFHFTVAGRSDAGYFGEAARWTWIDRPSGSTAAEPAAQIGNAWSFVPDLAGTYRIQLEYSDGVGFSDPVTSAPITAVSGPMVSGLVDEQATVDVPLRLEGQVTHAIGYPAFEWTLSSVPNGSGMTADYYAGENSNSLVFVADVAGAYAFDVIVNDSGGQSAPVHFTVTASQ